jgi:hypothetical protein
MQECPLFKGYCCKSRKSNNPKNLAKVDLRTSLLLRRFSTPLRRSVINFGSTDMVPHIAERKTHQRLQEFSFDTSKRLLQQYLHIAALDVCDGTSAVGESRHRIPRRIRWSTD